MNILRQFILKYPIIFVMFGYVAFFYTLLNMYGLVFVNATTTNNENLSSLGGERIIQTNYNWWPFMRQGDTIFKKWYNVYFTLEGIFFLYVSVLKYKVFNFVPSPLPWDNKIFPQRRRKLLFDHMEAFLKRVGKDEGKRWLENWFFGTKYSNLGGENVIEFLSFAYFKIYHLKDLTLEHREELVKYREKIYKEFGALPNVYKQNVVCMKNSLDPITPNVKAHPLILYVVVRLFLGIICTRIMLWYFGFTRYEGDLNVVCYVKKPAASDRNGSSKFESEVNSVPLLFFHGIGIGWLPYIRWFQKFSTHKSRPVIIIEQPNVAVEFPNPFMPISMKGMCDVVKKILHKPDYLGIKTNNNNNIVEKIDLLGHSYGTCPVTWILRHFSHNIRNVTYVDPVCMQLYRADVCKRFLYSPSALNMIDAFVSHLLQDIGITRTLMRSFDWFDNTLFLNELEHVDAEIILSEKDHFTPTKGIAEDIESWDRSKIGMRVFPNSVHGQSLFDKDGFAHVFRCVERNAAPRPRRSVRIRNKRLS